MFRDQSPPFHWHLCHINLKWAEDIALNLIIPVRVLDRGAILAEVVAIPVVAIPEVGRAEATREVTDRVAFQEVLVDLEVHHIGVMARGAMTRGLTIPEVVEDHGVTTLDLVRLVADLD